MQTWGTQVAPCLRPAARKAWTVWRPASLDGLFPTQHEPPLVPPCSPQELARVVASGLGRVVQFSAGAPPRLCGVGNPNTLALSRALGDNCELG